MCFAAQLGTLCSGRCLPVQLRSCDILHYCRCFADALSRCFEQTVKNTVPHLYLLQSACRRCLGITLSFHRQLSHRSFQTPKWLEYVLAYCGVLAVQGDPTEWVSSHRFHHLHTDTPLDPHSPYEGFWWSHMGWLLDEKVPMSLLVSFAPFASHSRRCEALVKPGAIQHTSHAVACQFHSRTTSCTNADAVCGDAHTFSRPWSGWACA